MHSIKMMTLWSLFQLGCALTQHQAQPAQQGRPASMTELVESLRQPGVVILESIVSANWKADRGGLINLKHSASIQANLQEGLEPIQIYFHAIRHPHFGTYIVDTGVEQALRDAPFQSALSWWVRSAMHMEHLDVRTALGDWLAKGESLKGVWFTHLHLDHLSGLPDVPRTTPLFSGPGEAQDSRWLYFFVRTSADRALDGRPPLAEWPFVKDEEGPFQGIIDIFGDGSVWALWVPGHTPGSTAYLVRTTEGPVLLLGDACHTQWGWMNGVEPGGFSAAPAEGALNFRKLKAFVDAHPEIQVRTGHQG